MNINNSGLVSVGHLITAKTVEDYKKTFRHFCSFLTSNLEATCINKSSTYWMFDQFFKTMEPTVESFAKFLGGVLRFHDTDFHLYELTIERCVWDIIKFDYLQYERNTINNTVLYRLYTIFNRFSQPDTDPLKVVGKCISFIFKRLGILSPNYTSMTLDQFLIEVVDRRDPFVLSAINKMYEEYVLDIVIEEIISIRVSHKHVGFSMGHNSVPRRVTLTSHNLVIECDAIVRGPNEKFDTSGKVMEKLSLFGASFNLGKYKAGKPIFSNKSQNKISIVMSEKVVEMTFDSKQVLHRWMDAIVEAIDCTNNNVNRLTRTKAIHGLGAHNKFPQMFPGVRKPSVNKSSENLAEIVSEPIISHSVSESDSLPRVQSAPDLNSLEIDEKLRKVIYEDLSEYSNVFDDKPDIKTPPQKPKRKTGHVQIRVKNNTQFIK